MFFYSRSTFFYSRSIFFYSQRPKKWAEVIYHRDIAIPFILMNHIIGTYISYRYNIININLSMHLTHSHFLVDEEVEVATPGALCAELRGLWIYTFELWLWLWLWLLWGWRCFVFVPCCDYEESLQVSKSRAVSPSACNILQHQQALAATTTVTVTVTRWFQPQRAKVQGI